EARMRTPPRFGGLGLAGIQSEYGEAAKARCRLAPTANAVIPAPVTAARLRKSRRVTPRRVVGRGSVAGIEVLLPVRVRRTSHRHRVKSREGCYSRRGALTTTTPPPCWRAVNAVLESHDDGAARRGPVDVR